ncbi:type IV pilus twitching motility protein PilT [Arthrobacter sp. zg-Y1110]|uniref:type IV pilus twitching motility protein PilT n=1 Tax=Arthrobacter sp. zg-Y1110 TaxID=2886932 RepID=UPI001D148BB1|nr:ATPase, T2SS/T4P/T4SS family [Arthrobacter sp. zg-Y1110]MCC3292559.1 Flp pilus assembly complex ATPase component TadA [Arthrobacter sp. zg-Y1110]UWX87009.1 ATPase, T2SS/T4P/T4SS family [Arthrobacter sp. zg-Y1110]
MNSAVLTRREMRASPPAAEQATSAFFSPRQSAVARLHRLIDECGDTGVSDMHIHPAKPMRRLRSGRLFIPDGTEVVFTQDEILLWLAEATEGRPDPLNPRGHASVALATDKYRVRGTFRKSLQGITVTFRIIPGVVPDVNDIGVPKVIQELMRRDSGLLIMEGPTGSGKTTAIAGLIKMANTDYDKHIYMVEDPTEFVHDEIGATSIIQREIGTHVVDYPTAIEDALRSKPNIIVVGELLNAATAKAALHAATTGHLVITTAHAGSITEALDSFIGQFTADEQPQIRSRFSQSLLGIMVQKLVPTVDGRLTAAREVLLNDLNFTEIIRDNQMQMIRSRIAGSRGCFTLEDSLAELVKQNAITAETAISAAKNPDDLRETMTRKGVAF